MLRLAALATVVSFATATGIVALPSAGAATSSPADSKPICKYVLASDPGALPYQLCQSKAQWDALMAQYAKDANRMVCHYEEEPGTMLGGHKLCGPLSAWEARREQARETTERIQMSTCVPGAGC
jgi:hypothetical protein